MSSAALFALRAAIATNTLTADQQGPLLEVLDLIAPVFPSPDEVATVGAIDVLVAREWTAALYAINAGGGIMPPPPGGITNVVGVPPIDVTVDGMGVATTSITPATDADAGSMSGADKTKLDGLSTHGWLYDADLPATVVLPRLAQAQATAGSATSIYVRTQDARTGSNEQGGRFDVILGARDGNGQTGLGTYFTVSKALAPGFAEPFATNIYNGLTVAPNPESGVTIATMGRGTNGVGLGTAGNELSAFGPLSIATELAAGGGPIASVVVNPVVSGAGPQPAIGLSQDPDGSPYASFISSGSAGAAASGYARFEYAPDRPILAQLANDGVTTVGLVSRVGGEVYYGDYALESLRVHARSAVRFELTALEPDAGWIFAEVFRVEFDPEKPIRHGMTTDAKDGKRQRLLPFDTASTGANQAIASISLVDGVTQLSVIIEGNQVAGGADFATYVIVNSFRQAGGVITPSDDPDVVQRTGGTTATTGVAPRLVINANRVEVQVTPWTADDVHWLCVPSDAANTGLF